MTLHLPTHFCWILLELLGGLIIYKEGGFHGFTLLRDEGAEGDSLPAGLSIWVEQCCCSGCLHLPSHLCLPGLLPNAAVLLSCWPLPSHVNTALVSIYYPPSVVHEGAGALFHFRSKEPFWFLHLLLLSPGFTCLKDRSGFSKCSFLVVTVG